MADCYLDIEFSVTSSDLSANAMSERLGMMPDRMREKGALIRPNNPSSYHRYTYSEWSIRASFESHMYINYGMDLIMARVEMIEPQLLQLTEEGCRITLTFCMGDRGTSMEMDLSQSVMHFLSRMNGHLAICCSMTPEVEARDD